MMTRTTRLSSWLMLVLPPHCYYCSFVSGHWLVVHLSSLQSHDLLEGHDVLIGLAWVFMVFLLVALVHVPNSLPMKAMNVLFPDQSLESEK